LFALRLTSDESIRQNWKEKLNHMWNNMPEVIREMAPTADNFARAGRWVDEEGRPLIGFNIGGPLVSRMILEFGAKCGLALHSNKIKRALPVNERVLVLIYSNYEALAGSIPQDLFELLPERRSLGRGKTTAHGSFEFSSAVAEDGDTTMHWATFGETFMFYLFAGQVEPAHENIRGLAAYAPGFLKPHRT
jgi:hypothetical protein